MRPVGLALSQYDWCLCKKRVFGYTARDQGWAGTEERPCEEGEKKAAVCTPRSKSLGANPADTLSLDFQPSELGEINFWLLKPPSW